MKIAEPLKDLQVPIDSIQPREGNPRQGDLEVIKESLEVNGQYRPIVVNQRDNEILAGNHTYKAAQELGWPEIAATWVDADEEEAARIVLVDNRANDVATYDNETLLQLLNDLEDLKGTGFSNAAVSDLLREVGTEAITDGETDPDDIPEEPEPEDVKTKAGDIWQLGPHRLICGDSTDQAVIEKLMDGRKADLLLTDPPYGVDYGEKNEYLTSVGKNNRSERIINDELTGDELRDLLKNSLSQAKEHMAKGNPAYVFSPQGPDHHLFGALFGSLFKHTQILIWVKHRIGFGRQDYQWQHEPILYGWKEGAAHKWYGGYDKSTVIEDLKEAGKLSKEDLIKLTEDILNQIQTTVIFHDRPHKSGLHPTTKPVGLLEPLIQNSSQIGDAVLDIFAGSGSTLMACERTGRDGYMCELDPAYCDVIVKRWEDYTGKTAQKVEKEK